MSRDALAPYGPRVAEQDSQLPDLIIRSGDGIDFHVHKSIMSFGSPFFNDMLSFPAPAATSPEANAVRDGKPIVTLLESSVVVEKMVSLCYPLTYGGSVPPTLDGIALAYSAVDKYLVAGARDIFGATLLDPRLLHSDPYRVFAIACYLRNEFVAKEAAISSLDAHATPRTGIPEFDMVTASATLRLQVYRFRCSQTARMLANRYSDSIYSGELAVDDEEQTHVPAFGSVWWLRGGHTDSCGVREDVGPASPGDADSLPAEWFCQHICQVRKLLVDKPSHTAVRVAVASVPVSLLLRSRCLLCADRAPLDLQVLAEELASAVRQSNLKLLGETKFVDELP